MFILLLIGLLCLFFGIMEDVTYSIVSWFQDWRELREARKNQKIRKESL